MRCTGSAARWAPYAVDRVLRLSVFVNAVEDFVGHPDVRVASLPLGVPVEVELTVRLR